MIFFLDLIYHYDIFHITKVKKKMSEQTQFKIIGALWFFFAAMALWVIAVQCRHSVHDITHDECVAYWSNRTDGWANAPTAATISNSVVFCGDGA